jgi:uncharacterized protein YhaN
MRIVSLTLHPDAGWPEVDLPVIHPGLNVLYGAHGAGKTTLWQFLAHVLYGRKDPIAASGKAVFEPQGEIGVEHDGNRYRLRRCRDEAGRNHLKIAAVDGAPVDQNTIRTLLHGLSPRVLNNLFAVSFESTADIGRLLSAEFAREVESIGVATIGGRSRKLTELAARRDVLAHELETRIAGERRVSQELDQRWRELDRRVREEQQIVASDDERLQTVDAALAETDARLRYRRLELNTQLRLHADNTTELEPELHELDNQIAKWRATLGELSERESALRGRLAQLPPGTKRSSAKVSDERAWLAMSRQLTADLAGEVARLARASQSQQCVCHDAHPRLRPISESIQRQLDVLQNLLTEQNESRQALALQQELDQLSRTQDELRRHVEGLLDRRESFHYAALPHQSLSAQNSHFAGESTEISASNACGRTFSAIDAEQLERRRLELEQQRYELAERLRAHSGKLRDLKAQRDTVERQRAALLSARSIEHVQRELADVQRKLQLAAAGAEPAATTDGAVENPIRASDFLAQLTDGNLVRVMLVDSGRAARVVNRSGEALAVEQLSAAERDQLYLSLCMALVSSASQHGITLPVVLDNPFSRLDSKGIAALATVLADFSRQGHQVLVFTGQPIAAERMTSVGAAVHDITKLRPPVEATAPEFVESSDPVHIGTERPIKIISRTPSSKKRRKKPTSTPLNGKTAKKDQSDAA